DAGLTWKAYMEAMPTNCDSSNAGRYAVKHDPFVYYGDLAGNATRCSRVVPAGPSDQALLNDLDSVANASNYMWLTPDLCNDMHDCNVTVGDAFMRSEEHTSELQSRFDLVCRLLLEKKKEHRQ